MVKKLISCRFSQENQYNEPSPRLIIGDSGVGKSSILLRFCVKPSYELGGY